jgi:hypothetical protein
MLQGSLFDEMTVGRFNPPVIVDQLRMLPIALPTEDLVEEIEADFHLSQQNREAAMQGLAALLASESFKDDGAAFRDLILSFERHADEIAAKVHRLEKRIRRAQKAMSDRDIRLDERLLNIARKDLEDRIDLAMFWRALQAKIWPTSVSSSFETGSDVGKALRAAIG